MEYGHILKQMHLPEEVLTGRLADMPAPPEHQMVWHLCSLGDHLSQCYKVGQLAVVTAEVPELPDTPKIGDFLMRLHPPVEAIQPLADGQLGVNIRVATSFRFAIVWAKSEPLKKA